jgi:hypothetical protein
VDRSGWYVAHKIGDLIKVIDRTSINLQNVSTKIGDLGVVIESPEETNGILFIEVYMFRTGIVRWFSPQEIDIISNIDE